MGHHLFDGLARTPSLKRIVAMLGVGAGAPGAAGVGPGTLEEIAAAMLTATESGLERAKGDEGLAYSLYLMASLTQAATAQDFATAIGQLGLPPPFAPRATPGQKPPPAAGAAAYTVFDLVSGFSAAVDRHLRETRSRTAIGELAQLAASESLSALCSQTSDNLFGESRETVRESLRKLGTERGFGILAHDFFARMSRRYLEPISFTRHCE
jgi:hypothetical protein